MRSIKCTFGFELETENSQNGNETNSDLCFITLSHIQIWLKETTDDNEEEKKSHIVNNLIIICIQGVSVPLQKNLKYCAYALSSPYRYSLWPAKANVYNFMWYMLKPKKSSDKRRIKFNLFWYKRYGIARASFGMLTGLDSYMQMLERTTDNNNRICICVLNNKFPVCVCVCVVSCRPLYDNDIKRNPQRTNEMSGERKKLNELFI